MYETFRRRKLTSCHVFSFKILIFGRKYLQIRIRKLNSHKVQTIFGGWQILEGQGKMRIFVQIKEVHQLNY